MREPIRVLHVDDEPDFADLTATFLQREGDRFTVETATSASDGMDRLADAEFDCVVSDYEMPGRNGIEFLEAVHEAYPDLPFILFTGKGSEEIASEAISAGITDYLEKQGGTEQYTVLANRIENAVAQYRAEAEVERTREYFGTILDHSSDFVMIVDKTGTVDYVSPAVERMLGYTPEELDGTDPFERIHPADRERALAAFADVLEQPDAQRTLEYRARHADGSWVWLGVRGRNLLDNPTVEGVIVNVREITDRKEREQTLTALHDAAREIGRADDAGTVYETLIDTAERVLDFDLVVVDVEHDGYLVQEAWTVDFASESGYQKTSLTADDTFAVRAYNRQETILVEDLQESEITPASPGLRSVLTVPIGEFGTFQAAATEVAAFEEQDREFAELLVDHGHGKLHQLEDRQQLRDRTAQLERTNDRLDEFVSVVSHDLRNPLNTLELSLGMAEREGDAEHFQRCQRAVDRMHELLEDLLALAREGQDLDEPEPVLLADVVEESLETVETESIEVAVETDRRLVADSGRLRQLLENLFGNAIDHGGEGVRVTVGELDDGFYVADDGPGIPADERGTVFEPGYSTADDGTGFGLSIVQRIAEAHGWRIDVTDSEGGGARFEITGVDTAESTLTD